MSGVGAADVGDAGLGKTEEPDLSVPDEISDRPRNVVDRDRRADAMLIEEVDVIGLEPAERAVHRFANAPRPLSRSVPTCFPPSIRKPNLVQSRPRCGDP